MFLLMAQKQNAGMLSRRLGAFALGRGFSSAAKPPAFVYQPLFDLSPDTKTQYKKLVNASQHVSVQTHGSHKFLNVGAEGTRLIAFGFR